MTISSLSTADYQLNLAQGMTPPSAQGQAQRTTPIGSDSVQFSGSSTGTAGSNSSDYTVDPRILAYEQRMASDTDPKFMLYTKVLTDSDKNLLSTLNGGNWQMNGPANLLVDQIAAARQDGSLNGPVSASFIQGIMAKQSANDAINPHQAEIPASVLNQALALIKTDSQQAGNAAAS